MILSGGADHKKGEAKVFALVSEVTEGGSGGQLHRRDKKTNT